MLYAAVSFQQYRRMDSYIFDLGFFESVVRDYAHGHLPSLQVTDSTTAALHFSPALAAARARGDGLVLAVGDPARAGRRGRRGVVPLMRAAGAGAMAWVVAVSYGLAPGFGALIGFDFHEVALGVPLIALSMAAMLRADHRAAVLWALPLILVKEDLGLTIAALGAVVFLRGSRRWGVFAMVFGAVAFLAIQWWVLPAINGDTGGFADKYAPSGRRRPADPHRRRCTPRRARCCSCSSRPGCSRCAHRCCCWSRCRPSRGGSSPTSRPTGTPGTSTTPSSSRSPSPR